ncbi:flagellin [Acerihabitans sp. TG2]|uniref:flagellin N-terminal helical domain-containing protein n=1 Tax=Acerihabitans sp. TG2 TaxID=3096008 RepID=UPI002B238725|nr:flagellin [Acerihabitans sp. TG2]MEA9392575.1 flagellin [Acerihabitans sp. TG2]
MAQVINTNSISLLAQNNLNKSQASLSTAIERLSSGLRINSAKDDAAGQAISNRFTSNINGLTQASRNANDGISLAQTTEGALNEINTNLQAIRTLTVQSQTGTNSASDLQSIQDEVTQRLSEVDRISKQTDFNGVKVLSSDKNLSIQVGSNDGETIDINLKQIDSGTLKLNTFNVNGPVGDAGDITAITTKVTGSTKDNGAIVSSGNAAATTAATGGTIDPAVLKDGTSGNYYVKITDSTAGVHYFQADLSTDTDGNKTYTIASGTAETAGAETTAAAAGTAQPVFAAGVDAKVSTVATDNNKTTPSTYSDTNMSLVQDKNGHTFVKDSSNGAYYAADVSTATAADGTKTITAVSYDSSKKLQAADKNPLKELDTALATVDTLRSNLGAVQNRFDSTINNLTSTTSNLSEAQSRIQDADYATEVSNMSKAQILQQAGTSVLAQANQVPQTVLSLLK